MKHALLVLVVMVSACAKPQVVGGHPDDRDLRQTLRLSEQEWEEIQAEFKAGEITRNTKPNFWARTRTTGVVEVHCIRLDLNSPLPPKSGPVFFFDVRDGHWRLLQEMSEWKN